MHPKNTTAPPGAQHLPAGDKLDVIFTHTYHQVTVMPLEDGARFSFPGLRNAELAKELALILRPCFPLREIQVIWIAANPNEDLDSFVLQDARMTDMIVSVRTAANPGHEFLSRLGYFGECEGRAPQKDVAPIRGAGGAV